jgi:hypothetical protein
VGEGERQRNREMEDWIRLITLLVFVVGERDREKDENEEI